MFRIVVFHFHICFAPAEKWGFFILILFGIFDEILYGMEKDVILGKGIDDSIII